MSERRKIFDLFEEQKDFVEARIADGIEKHRKGNAVITVTDADGNPIPGTSVKVTQKTHEFRFGANIFMLDELETEEKNRAYKKYFADVFNMATLPFYWDTLEPERGKTRYEKGSPKIYRRPAVDLCMEFCAEHGIEPREHALAYENFFPAWLSDASVAEVKEALESRFAEVARRYSNKIRTIEVVNEMEVERGKTAFYDEPDYVEWCFKTAEKYFPNNQLVVNDHTPLGWKDRGRASDKYYAYIEANLLKGARIDAIGMQYHLFNRPRETEYEKTRLTLNPKKLYHQMDLYANFGKPLQITEVTLPAYSWEPEDEVIQAELLEKLYSIWFSHPNVEQIIYWNLVDGYGYTKNVALDQIRATQGDMTLGENYYYGGLLRYDMSPKPAYNKLKELTQEVWHTEQTLSTDNSGKVAFRGFYGTYDIAITVGSKTATKTIELSSKTENNIFAVQL